MSERERETDPGDDRGEPSPSRSLAPAPARAALALPMPIRAPSRRLGARAGLLAALRRRRATLLAALAIALLAAWVATVLTSPLYVAEALLLIHPGSANPAGDGGQSDPGRDFFATQYALLDSRTLALRALATLARTPAPPGAGATDETPLAALRAALQAWTATGMARARALLGLPEPTQPDPADRLLAHLRLTRVGESRLVRLAVAGADPEEAAASANALAQAALALDLERRRQAVAGERAYVQGRLDLARAGLDAAERRLSQYLAERGGIDPDRRLEILTTRLADLSREQSSAQTARGGAQARSRQLAQSGGRDAQGAAASPTLADLQGRLAELEARYREDLKIFKPKYPRMQQLAGQIAEIERQIAAESAALGRAARGGAQAGALEEAGLAARIADTESQIRALAAEQVGYRALQRDLETGRRVYEGLAARLAESAASALGPAALALIDPAVAPRAPERPSLARNLAWGGGLGLCAGLLLAWTRERTDDRVRSGGDVERRIGAPVLGRVPRVADPGDPGLPAAMGTLALEDPDSALAAAYRSLRTALLFATPAGTPRLLHLASAVPGEGKTSAACGVAIAFAELGGRVLLVDCDLQAPALHRDLRLPNERGLAECLSGEAAFGQSALSTRVPGLSLLPGGAPPARPLDLLCGGRMAGVLREALEGFDVVILDGPAVRCGAEAEVLAGLAQATLLVVEPGASGGAKLADSAGRLRATGGNLLGAVLVKDGAAGAGI